MKKMFYRILSTVLSLSIISLCCVFSISAEIVQPEITTSKIYYVSAGGSDMNNGLTSENALLTIGKAVSIAKLDGLESGDVATLRFVGTDAVEWGNVAEHTFTLVLDSDDKAQKATVSIPGDTHFMGDTVFKYIKMSIPTETALFFDNHNVTFDTGAEGSATYTVAGTVSSNTEVAGQKLIFRNAISGYQVKLASDWSGTKYTDDVSVEVDNGNATPVFTLGGNYGTVSTFQNLNINIKSAQSVGFAYANGAPVVNGVIQIINSSSSIITAKTGDLALVAKSKKYIINNKSGGGDLLSFTDTAGKYAVNEDKFFDISATDASGKVTTPVNGYLTLKAGEYTVNASKIPTEKTYYVCAAGSDTNDGTTAENPFLTVGKAVEKANEDGLFKGDTVTVQCIGTEEISWGNVPGYSFTLVLDSKNAENKATISIPNKSALGGDTIFKSVKIVISGEFTALFYNNKNITFDVGSEGTAEYIIAGESYSSSPVAGQRITFKNAVFGYQIKLGSDWKGNTYTEDVNVEVDNTQAQPVFTLSGNDNASTFNNINFNIKNASAMAFSYSNGAPVVKGALQIINSSSVAISGTMGDLALINKSKKYIINNTSGKTDLLSFTDTAGIFTVKSGYEQAVMAVNNSTGEEIVAQDGKLNLMPGDYTVRVNQMVYAVDGKATIDGKEIDIAPAGSVVTVENTSAPEGKVFYKWVVASGALVLSDEYSAVISFVMPQDSIKLEPVYKNDPSTKKMLYFKVGAGSADFTNMILVEPNETYIMSYSIFCTEQIEIFNALDIGHHGPYKVNEELLTEEKHSNYTKYVYKFTIPAEGTTDSRIMLGFQIPYYAEGYIFDMSCHKADDPYEKEIYSNADFKLGLDRWMWGWDAWFAVFPNDPAGQTEWEKGINKLKVVDYDLCVIDTLKASLNIDDGTWWRKDDIIEKSNSGFAIVKGTLTDQNKQSISNVKLLLISDKKTYIAYTNAKGVYRFENVIEGFYELYLINSAGEKISTGYYSNLEANDIAVVSLIIDSSENVSLLDDDGAVPTGSLLGTVYTPERKTVANIKICLKNFGEIAADENGKFSFVDIPTGKYELYTILKNGKKYVFRTVEINENVDLSVKLKYSPEIKSVNSSNGISTMVIVWICVISGVVLLLTAAGVIFILKRKKFKKL